MEILYLGHCSKSENILAGVICLRTGEGGYIGGGGVFLTHISVAGRFDTHESCSICETSLCIIYEEESLVSNIFLKQQLKS